MIAELKQEFLTLKKENRKLRLDNKEFGERFNNQEKELKEIKSMLKRIVPQETKTKSKK